MLESTKQHIQDLYYLVEEIREMIDDQGYASDWVYDSLSDMVHRLTLDIDFETMIHESVIEKRVERQNFNHKWSIPEKFLLDDNTDDFQNTF